MTRILALLLLVSCPALAADAALPAGARLMTDVAFLAPGRTEKLDVYLPAPPPAGKLSPAVVWIHGGGWTGGTKVEARAKNICSALVSAGYVALNIDYKLGEGAWPTNLHDCKNAVRFLRTHAKEWQVDPDRIAVAGGSAGGHLALMVGYTSGLKELEPDAPYPGVSSAVRAVINMYGISDIFTRREIEPNGTVTDRVRPLGPVGVYGHADNKAAYRLASPVSHIGRKTPPTLILHGDKDTTVDLRQSTDLAALLAKAGVPHELVVVPGAGHTFDWATWSKKPLSRDVRAIALAFLEKHLAPAAK
ncbi:MAG: alpha/beta hydrolase [Verrucomicrobia bacterium]|nr:alpha/beta hydrolase [Verrucomicrobiota bacterium]